jgi:hypothetical protein
MDHLARPYLDTLTTQELALLADDCGIDIPADLDRIFIIEELLDYKRAEEEDLGEEEPESRRCPETAPIPRQYNINFIDVIVRDPLWVFVFWEIKEHDRDAFEKDPAFSGYFLRVSPAGGGKIRADRSFSVQVETGDSARYLGFSEYSPEPGGAFQIELCAGFDGRWEAVALSRVFRLPRLQETEFPGQEGALPPSLPVLSGLNEFPILRRTDRPGNFRFSGGVR